MDDCDEISTKKSLQKSPVRTQVKIRRSIDNYSEDADIFY